VQALILLDPDPCEISMSSHSNLKLVTTLICHNVHRNVNCPYGDTHPLHCNNDVRSVPGCLTPRDTAAVYTARLHYI
jgi:hypothetical protein